MKTPANPRRMKTRTPPNRSGQRGLSLLETTVVLCLIGLMISGTLHG